MKKKKRFFVLYEFAVKYKAFFFFYTKQSLRNLFLPFCTFAERNEKKKITEGS